jgi:hypothetical protein
MLKGVEEHGHGAMRTHDAPITTTVCDSLSPLEALLTLHCLRLYMILGLEMRSCDESSFCGA